MLFPQQYPVTCHTGHVGPGSTFVAIDGFTQTGTQFIAQAIAQGATHIVLDEKWRSSINLVDYPASVTFTFVADTRKELALRAAVALGNSASKLSIIGVTGTKGKTTTTFLTEHILHTAGYKTALLGGVKNKIGDREEDSPLTTLNSDDLHMFFSECVKNGVTHVVMEVSSHAIALDRVYGINFAAAGFTNLASEHMDFHPTLDHYFETKTKLFAQVKPGGAIVINVDDVWGNKAAEKHQHLAVVPFGMNCGKNFEIVRNTLDGLEIFLPTEKISLRAPYLFGEFNAYNIVMAARIANSLGVSWNVIQQAIEEFKGVPGRLQMHPLKNGAKAFVDFAHASSSVEAVLKALRPLTEHLIVVFGCGGDRDKTKRPVMGKFASIYGDVVIVTDDNPRNEDRHAIIQQICTGIIPEKKDSTWCIPDRHEAIQKAVSLAKPTSVIALLGKGHETYYLCKGVKYHFSDYEEIQKF